MPICQAVQHAHQKGIVHRDLKPANILVTIIDGKPVPKVIDFGVAKATAGKLTDESMSTQFGAVIGTLEYMSPEQTGFSGVDIDTRADIYSLGVILYELLTGLRPIDARRLKKAAITEMIRIIREEEPSKPSTRLSTDESLPSMAALRQTEPRKLMALLRGELDWVVMKCLEKHRERRYETANALARDIQRYLADEAVEARPPSARYRLGKFLRRNRGPVLAASLVLLALVGGIVGTTYGMIRAEQRRVEADEARRREAKRAEGERLAREQEAEQRAKAEKARDRTRQALDAMTSSVTGDSLTTQKEISAEQKKFLTEVLTYYQEFAGEKADDEAVAGPNGGGGGSGRYHRVPPGSKGGSGGRHPPGPRRVREAGRRLPRRAGLPPEPGRQPLTTWGYCWPTWGSVRRRRSSIGKPWQSRRSWPPSFPPCRCTASTWPTTTTTWGVYWPT